MDKKLKSLIENIIQAEFIAEKKKAKKEPEEDIDISIDEPAPVAEPASLDAEPALDVDSTAGMDMSGGESTEKQVGKGLQMALDAAKQLPDSENKSKLIRQIGNTALFFLKTQIPGTGEQM
jgi:hypothetical protein